MSTKYQIPDGFKIVSGGQSGADQAALDWAIANQVNRGGWCPKGRRAEHGPIEARYQLAETPNTNYLERTEWNVRDSDATVIFTLGETLEGGSKKTAAFAEKYNKPCLHFRPRVDPKYLVQFLARNNVVVLNIAGTREALAPSIGDLVTRMLDQALDVPDRPASACIVNGGPTQIGTTPHAIRLATGLSRCAT